MKTEIPIVQLLRWRLERAEAEAPSAPRAVRLLELVRPWWVTWPEQFRSFVDRLNTIRVAYGHAMADATPSRGGYPVPTLLVHVAEEVEVMARVLYLNVRDGRLRLRFQIETTASKMEPTFEATFVSNEGSRPLLSAPASRSVDQEYRVDTELPPELARSWEQLRVTDRMPFGLILRAEKIGD